MRVLVIDDEPDILWLCGVMLAHDGYEVLKAYSADVGLELALNENPDVIVLDLMLPRRDGFSLLDELVTTPVTREIPVVLLTARIGPQDRARGWGAGASGYIAKPFTPAMLNETIRVVAGMSPEERCRVREQALSVLDPALKGPPLPTDAF